MKVRRGPQGDSTRHTVSKAKDDSFSQTPARLTEGHLDPEAALGLCCLQPDANQLFSEPNTMPK